MFSVQNYRLTTPQRVTFKSGENANSERRENDGAVYPYKTKAGLKTGAWYSGIGAVLSLLLGSGTNMIAKFSKNAAKEFKEDVKFSQQLEQNAKELKGLTNKMWITLPISILTSLACGMLVDSAINKKQAEFADKFNKEGRTAALNDEDRAEITKKDNVYLTTNIGKKLGPILGAVVLPTLSLVNNAIIKVKSPSFRVGNVIGGAIGGLILGAITDKVANKGAAKYADKQAAVAAQIQTQNIEE